MERKLFFIKNWNYRTLFWGSVVFAFVVSSSLGTSAYLYFSEAFPQVSILKGNYPLVKYQGKGERPIVSIQSTRPSRWVSYSQISRVAVGAVIVSEDWAFFQHAGFDAKQIKEAIKEDIEEGKFARGASTITQQVVKNVFLTNEKSIWRKIKELILAVELEKSVSKKRILEIYFNVAEWGEGIYGIHHAAQHYFGKHPSNLLAEEGAFLAMLLPSPIRYSQSFRKKSLTRFAKRSIQSILNKMAQAQYISHSERERAKQSCLSFLGCEPLLTSVSIQSPAPLPVVSQSVLQNNEEEKIKPEEDDPELLDEVGSD